MDYFPTTDNISLESLLSLATHFLSLGDLSDCRNHALLAQESHPGHPKINQILAIADVLSAAKTHPHDHHSILQLPQNRIHPENSHLVHAQYQKLVALLNPSGNRFPFVEEALDLVQQAWGAFSDSKKKTQLHNKESVREGAGGSEKVSQEGESGEGDNVGGGSFWTVCPYCFYLFEYEKVYEDCCLKCHNCNMGFHGVAIELPRVVEGKDEYYCCLGVFGVKFGPFDVDVDVAQENSESEANHVKISDDSDSENSEDDYANAKQNREPKAGFQDVKSGVSDGNATEKPDAERKGVRSHEIGNKSLELKNLVKSMKNVKAVMTSLKKRKRTGLRNVVMGACVSSAQQGDIHVRCEEGKGEENELMGASASPAR